MRAHLAICSQGYVGLITSDAPVATPYSGDYQDVAWTGIHMTTKGGKQIGDRWQSKNPKILCHMAEPRAMSVVKRVSTDDRWLSYPGDFLNIRGFVANETLMIVESNDGDRYEHENGKWDQLAGTSHNSPEVDKAGNIHRA